MSLYATVKQLLIAEGHNELAKTVIEENISIRKVDNWNGGIFEVVINIPVSIYAEWKLKDIIDYSRSIVLDAFNDASIDVGYESYRDVIFCPSYDAKLETEMAVLSNEVSSWTRGYFKLFISHLTDDKKIATQLKRRLNTIGISCFVAHEDIEPTKIWQDEIVKALKTADALCAIISPHFIESLWCDQEVGFGMGRDILCIPLIYDRDPYGLLGMMQGVKCGNKSANEVTLSIFDILCSNRKTKDVYSRDIADLLLRSTDTNRARRWLIVIEHIKQVNIDLLEYIRLHYIENPILNEKDLIDKMNEILQSNGLAPIAVNQKTVDNEENDLPF